MKVHIPEVVEADDKLPPDLLALRRFAVAEVAQGMDQGAAVGRQPGGG